MEKAARKFKVICTGISGKIEMLTPKMGILTEESLPEGSFDTKVKKGEIIEIKGEKAHANTEGKEALVTALDELKIKFAPNTGVQKLTELLELANKVKDQGTDIPENTDKKGLEALLKTE